MWQSSYALLPARAPQDTEDEITENTNIFIEQEPILFCNCKTRRKQVGWWTLMNIILSTFNILIISTWTRETLTQNAILKKSSYYSPILNSLTIPTSTTQIQGSLFPPAIPSIGRAFPNAKSDAVWEEIELPRTIAITAEDVRRLGKDPENAARFEDVIWGFGEDAFMGQIDVFHQLHCLNSLRKLGYPAYYGNGTERGEMWYIHHNQLLYQPPMPGFRNFAAVEKENSVDMEKFFNLVKPKDVKEIPAPKEYFELFGEDGKRGKVFSNSHE